MKRLFKTLFFLVVLAAFAAGVAYLVKRFLFPGNGTVATSGVLPSQPVKSLDDAPLGGKISEELLKILVCPEDKGPLELVDDGKFLLNPRNGYQLPDSERHPRDADRRRQEISGSEFCAQDAGRRCGGLIRAGSASSSTWGGACSHPRFFDRSAPFVMQRVPA